MKKRLFKVLALTAALSMVALAPAAADGTEDNDANRDADLPHVNVTEGEDGEVELEFVNPTAFTFSFDYTVDGEPEGTADEYTDMIISEGPLAGQTFGLRYNEVTLEGEGSETVTVTAEDEVQVRLARGAEQQWYFDWITVDVDIEEEPVDEEPVDEEPPFDREAKDDCKDGGWQAAGFRNQGQCIASVVANDASVH